jgi:hypothetical protein
LCVLEEDEAPGFTFLVIGDGRARVFLVPRLTKFLTGWDLY